MLKITVKPRGRAKVKLAHRGKARVRIHVTFDPDGGAPRTKSRRILLRRR
jgi:hypothetical protein